MLDGQSISMVLDVLRPERAALIGVLEGLGADDWGRATECPAYSIKGIATHVLGDDLSLLSRQRDSTENGLLQLAPELPGAGFVALLDAFNDRWVGAARFFSPRVLVELLSLAGEWTTAYYEQVDPESPGEPVGFFGSRGASSPFWHAIGREYIERWAHHSQIRRALGDGSLAERRFLVPGVQVVAAAAGVEPGIPAVDAGEWTLGSVALGDAQQAADILTRAHPAARVQELAQGPAPAVALLAAFTGRP